MVFDNEFDQIVKVGIVAMGLTQNWLRTVWSKFFHVTSAVTGLKFEIAEEN